MQIYKKLARTLAARDNSNAEWSDRHQDTIDNLMLSAPHGSGFDSGTQLGPPPGLRFKTSYHHMNENGMYDGWTDHLVTVIPDLACDFTLKISGRNRNNIKEYILETFYSWLSSEVPND